MGDQVTVTDVRIVAMTRRHVGLLMPHEHAMFGTEAWSRGAYLGELTDPLKHYLACEDVGGALLGWAGVVVVADTAEILTVGVVPDARRRGIGRALLAELLGEAAGRGAREAFLEVRADNPAAIALYESDGFGRLGIRRGYYDAGRVDAITMRCTLGGTAPPAGHSPSPAEGGEPS